MALAIDLFSGCGGLTQGLKDAGFEVKVAVEIDNLASETYKANHAEVKLIESDIRSVLSKDIMKACGIKKGELDLLAGCPPCQGFSRIRLNNKKKRLSDPRNRLIDEVLRLVIEMEPKVIMLENVSNLSRYGRYLKFKKELKKMGYFVSDKILDAADFCVPQRRKRLVVLASRLGEIFHPAPINNRKTVRDAIGSLSSQARCIDLAHNKNEQRSERVLQIIKSIPKDGGSRTALSPNMMLKCHKERNGFYDVYGRMKWDDVSPTITGGCVNPSKGRFLHPEEDRAITLREAALLQSFPLNYVFSLSKGKYAAAKMIGNALPPMLSKIQAVEILSHLKYYQAEDRHAGNKEAC